MPSNRINRRSPLPPPRTQTPPMPSDAKEKVKEANISGALGDVSIDVTEQLKPSDASRGSSNRSAPPRTTPTPPLPSNAETKIKEAYVSEALGDMHIDRTAPLPGDIRQKLAKQNRLESPSRFAKTDKAQKRKERRRKEALAGLESRDPGSYFSDTDSSEEKSSEDSSSSRRRR